MDAALALFAGHGYDGTTVRMIAERAGVATGLLYAHFAGKEELLRALFERSMDDVRASFALADSAADPRERLAALVRGSVEILRANLDFWRVGYAARMQPSVLDALGPALDAWTATILATLRGYLAELGVDEPEVEARALFAQIDGMCQHFASDPARYPIDAVAARVVARWTAPLATPEET